MATLAELMTLVLAGLVVGVVVNALADRLPYYPRQRPLRYVNDSPRPPSAWSGVIAFLTGQRRPAISPETPPLSWRYPLTEVAVILLFLAVYAQHDQLFNTSSPQFLLYLVYMALFVLIAIIDLEHKLIQFKVMIPALVLAFADAAFLAPPDLDEALRGAALGFAVFLTLYLGGFAFTHVLGAVRGQRLNTVAFGFGDVMLITFCGALLGVAYTIVAIFIAVFLGAFGAISYLAMRLCLRGRYSLFTAIPYGPYIVAAAITMLLAGPSVWQAIFGYRPGL